MAGKRREEFNVSTCNITFIVNDNTLMNRDTSFASEDVQCVLSLIKASAV